MTSKCALPNWNVTKLMAVWVFVCLPAWPPTHVAAEDGGALKLELQDGLPTTTVYQGDQAEVRMTLRNPASNTVGPVIIAISVDGAMIETVKDKAITWQAKNGGLRGQVRQLKSGAVLPFVLKVNFSLAGADHAQRLIDGRLTVTAAHKAAASPAPQIDLRWQMRNCAGAYHAALTGINSIHVQNLKGLLKSARAGWRQLPGRWTFRPGKTRAGTAARTLITRANTLVRYRGLDPKLKQLAQSAGLTRVALELGLYAAQPQGPALCAGAAGYMDFFDGRMGGLREASTGISETLEQAAQIADWDLAASEVLFAQSLEVPDGEAKPKLKEQAGQLTLGLAAARSLWTKILDADATHGAILDHTAELRNIKAQIDTIGGDRRNPLHARRASLGPALSYIEAMIYLQGAYAKYHLTASGFGATISAVRDAHSENCVCSR